MMMTRATRRCADIFFNLPCVLQHKRARERGPPSSRAANRCARAFLSQAFEEVEPAPASRSDDLLPDDLLNFSIEDARGEGYATPGAPPGAAEHPLSASSASWVEEMNAELAEFDTMTSGLLASAGGGLPSSAGVDAARLDAELAAHGVGLQSPPPRSGR